MSFYDCLILSHSHLVMSDFKPTSEKAVQWGRSCRWLIFPHFAKYIWLFLLSSFVFCFIVYKFSHNFIKSKSNFGSFSYKNIFFQIYSFFSFSMLLSIVVSTVFISLGTFSISIYSCLRIGEWMTFASHLSLNAGDWITLASLHC